MTCCPTCGASPCINPLFCEVCRAADERKAQGKPPQHRTDWKDWPTASNHIPADWNDLSLEALFLHFASARPTPQSMIEAIMYCVRERGLKALKEPANVERLRQCDARAKAEINRRIQKLGIT